MNFVDLFCGCGGLSEGFLQENFTPLLLADIDFHAIETSKNRLVALGFSAEEASKICKQADLSKKENLNSILSDIDKTKYVDILVAGIPCQAFSSVGRAQDKNSMKNDSRNYLYLSLLNYINELSPKFVLIENVSGILSAKPKDELIINDIYKRLDKAGYKVHKNKEDILLNSVEFGVPQIRKRVIIFAVKKSIDIAPIQFYKSLQRTHYAPNEENDNLEKFISVKEAIGDLPKLKPGEGEEVCDNFRPKLNRYLKLIRSPYSHFLYNHKARKHNQNDMLRYYHLAKNNWQLKDLEKLHPELVHHDPKHFGNRYTVQLSDFPGKTVVSHLYKDGNLFIHPDYNQMRTFTVREAARIQSFPDDFIFSGSRTQQYKQVGNAVPVLLARALAKAIRKL
jgi:DNA (cytosine-5)-methyltransferase 1